MLRQLFEACALTVHYDPHSRLTTCAATATDAAIPAINLAAGAIAGPSASRDELGMLVARSAGHAVHPQPPTRRTLRVTGRSSPNEGGWGMRIAVGQVPTAAAGKGQNGPHIPPITIGRSAGAVGSRHPLWTGRIDASNRHQCEPSCR
jgi:hypothetical protein